VHLVSESASCCGTEWPLQDAEIGGWLPEPAGVPALWAFVAEIADNICYVLSCYGRNSMPREFPQLASGLLIALCLSQPALVSRAAEPEYSRDVTTWQAIQVPPRGKDSERIVWDYAANYSQLSWHVYIDSGRPYAKLIESPNDSSSDLSPFDAKADEYRGARRFKEVDDGWLVGFNHGEFGGALYWFNRNGTRHYKISSHQIVAFFSLPVGIYAIEGLGHLGISCGSMIHIIRREPAAHWQAFRVIQLPDSPSTVVVRRNGSVLIVLSNSLVSVSPNHQVTTIISDAPWGGLYPSSSILVPDEGRLYVGMRQFVADIDLTTNRLRLLVPSTDFLNKLPDVQERRIRAQYPNGAETAWHQPAEICEEMERGAIRNVR
jgi:hypothetical protein